MRSIILLLSSLIRFGIPYFMVVELKSSITSMVKSGIINSVTCTHKKSTKNKILIGHFHFLIGDFQFFSGLVSHCGGC